MENLVLYRKHRPQRFSEIIGQGHVVQTLTNALARNMISHGYLFCGPHGCGKTTMARLLAKAVNCQNRREGKAEPCNQCSSCQEIMQGSSIDLIEIDAASNRGIDEVRELRDGIRFSPTKSKYKVFILDEAHQLSKDAANALLKTLEEPPAHAIFVLATTEIHKMIATIISRCQRFDFRKLTLPEIVKRLEIICQREKVKIDRAALELIALNSSGAIRDGESLLDQALTFAGAGGQKAIKAQDIKNILGVVDAALVWQLVEFISQKNGSEALDFLNTTLDKGYNPSQFSRALIRYLRQALILKLASGVNSDSSQFSVDTVSALTPLEVSGREKKHKVSKPLTGLTNPIITGLTKEEEEKLMTQLAVFSEQDLRQTLKLFLDADNKIKYSPIPQLALELAIIDACQIRRQAVGERENS